MTSYKFSDVISIEFPQSGQQTKKRRPAVVILDIGDADLVVASVTSQVRTFSGDLELQDWSSAGLVLPSWVRLAKVFFANKNEVVRRFGRLSDADRAKVAQTWASLYGGFIS